MKFHILLLLIGIYVYGGQLTQQTNLKRQDYIENKNTKQESCRTNDKNDVLISWTGEAMR